MTTESYKQQPAAVAKSNGQEVVSKPKTSYLNYIHYFRAVAILGIVAVHCKSSFLWKSPLQEQFWSSVLVYSTILFVFIAGFLFQHIASRKFDYANYLSKKFQYVIVPYLIASIPAILEKLFIEPESMTWLPVFLQDQPAIFKLLYMLVTGKHFGPFWFIPMITLVYLITPVLLMLDKQPWFYRFVFPAMFIAGLFTFNFGFEFTTIESFVFFIPIYVFGMWASRYKEYITNLGNKLLIPLLVIFATFVALEMVGIITLDTSYGAYRPEQTFYFPFNFGKLKMSLLCLILLNGFHLIRDKKFPLLNLLADYSFGIYFVHLYVIRAFELVVRKSGMPLVFDSFVFVGHVALITAICCLIIFVVKKVTGKRSRYFVGS